MNAVNNAQRYRREPLEINPAPPSTDNDVLASSVCKSLSLTFHEVRPNDLQTCHCLKEEDTVVVKCECRRQKTAFLSTNRTSIINQTFLPNLTSQVGSLFRTACVTRIINYPINLDS